jgi:hypothetical protein
MSLGLTEQDQDEPDADKIDRFKIYIGKMHIVATGLTKHAQTLADDPRY